MNYKYRKIMKMAYKFLTEMRTKETEDGRPKEGKGEETRCEA